MEVVSLRQPLLRHSPHSPRHPASWKKTQSFSSNLTLSLSLRQLPFPELKSSLVWLVCLVAGTDAWVLLSWTREVVYTQ